MSARWRSKRLKFVARHARDTRSERPLDLPFLGLENVEPGTGKLLLHAPQEQVDSSVVCFHERSVLFGKLRPYLAKVATPDFSGVASTEFMVFEPVEDNCRQFLAYALLGDHFIKRVTALADGAKMPRADPGDIRNMRIDIPEPAQQLAVASYLDARMQAVDRLLGLRRRQIELLQEQRAALIQQAVTRGLDANVPLKASGVPWMPRIPLGWSPREVRRLVTLVTSGSRGWAEYYADEGDVFVQSGNLTRAMTLDLNGAHHVTPPPGAEGQRTRVECRDVLVCITGALTGNVAFVDFEPPTAFVNQHLALVRPNAERIAPKFLAYSLWSEVGKTQFKLAEYGGTKQGLGLEDVKRAVIALPPRHEQERIVEHIDRQMRVRDQLVNGYTHQLTLLAEYRTALIHECVTGKRPVP